METNEIMTTNDFSNIALWVSRNSTVTEVKGIPNFFSESMFGRTSELKSAAQIIVVSALVAVILRIFSRRRLKTRIWWDDVCTMAAVFFLVTNQTVFSMIDFLGKTSISFRGKQSQSEELKRLRKIEVGLKLALAFEVMYLISIYLVKFSMLFLYNRFAKHTKHITLYLRITQVICLVTFAVCILSLFLSCVPISMFWNLSNSNVQCTRRTLLTYTSGISNIITNTLVLAVPVPLLFRVKLRQRQKIGVSVLYFFGAFVIIASALRFATQLLNVSVPQAIGWSQIEISLAIILACAPMSTKLLFIPLINPKDIEKVSQMGDTPTSTGPECLIRPAVLSEKPKPYEPTGPQQLTAVRPIVPQQQQQKQLGQQLEQQQQQPQPQKKLYTGVAALPPVPNRSLSDAERKAAGRLEKCALEERTLNVGTMGILDDLSRGSRAPREISSPDYQRLKVVRAEVNGQSIWEVRPRSNISTISGSSSVYSDISPVSPGPISPISDAK